MRSECPVGRGEDTGRAGLPVVFAQLSHALKVTFICIRADTNITIEPSPPSGHRTIQVGERENL